VGGADVTAVHVALWLWAWSAAVVVILFVTSRLAGRGGVVVGSVAGPWMVAIEWKLPDLWLGAYWDRRYSTGIEADFDRPSRRYRRAMRRTVAPNTTLFSSVERTDVWVCIVPCLPIHIRRWRG
jgi:hypothetical protein